MSNIFQECWHLKQIKQNKSKALENYFFWLYNIYYIQFSQKLQIPWQLKIYIDGQVLALVVPNILCNSVKNTINTYKMCLWVLFNRTNNKVSLKVHKLVTAVLYWHDFLLEFIQKST